VKWLKPGDLRPLVVPLALFAVFGTLDALVTTRDVGQPVP